MPSSGQASYLSRRRAAGVAAAYSIDNSIWFDGAADYLSLTPVLGNLDTWTVSMWVKRAALGSTQAVFSGGAGSADSTMIRFDAGDQLRYQHTDAASVTDELVTTAIYRDTSAWYHIVVAVDTADATEANRVRVYVNGVEPALGTANYPAQNVDTDINSVVVHTVGAKVGSPANQWFNGYIAEVVVIEDLQLTPSSFGETDSNGVWIPKDPTELTFGTNGFWLDFEEAPAAYTDSSSAGSTVHTLTTLGTDGNIFTAGANPFGDSSNSVQLTTDGRVGFDGSHADFQLGTGDFTIEAWIKTSDTGEQRIWSLAKPVGGAQGIRVNSAGTVSTLNDGSGVEATGTALVDDGLWHHVAWVRHGTGTNENKLFTDGVVDAQWTDGTSWTPDADSRIGIQASDDASADFIGNIAECRFSDNARWTSDFSGSLPTAPYTDDANTLLLIHFDEVGLGKDVSGNRNHWAPISIAATQQTTDTPTNNFAVLNVLDNGDSAGSIKNGNLEIGGGSFEWCRATIPMLSGKWYMEGELRADGTQAGIGFDATGLTLTPLAMDGGNGADTDTGAWRSQSTGSNSGPYIEGTKLVTVDPIALLTQQVAIDVDAGKAWLGIDDTWYDSGGGTTGNPSTGANPTHTFTAGTMCAFTASGNGASEIQDVNFGQAGLINQTGDNADANGFGSFDRVPPTNFLCLCTANLPAPTVADGSAGFQAEIYTGGPIFTDVSGQAHGTGDHTLGTDDASTVATFKKFGNGSGFFPGTISDAKVQFPNSTDWDFGASGGGAGTDFTIDWWQYWDTTVPNVQHYYVATDEGGSSGWAIYSNDNSDIVLWDGSADAQTWSHSSLNDVWTHMAIVRSSGTITFWANGASVATFTDIDMNEDGGVLNIGGTSGGNSNQGYMDEVRISDNARWTADFSGSLPTGEYTSDANTLLLLHMNLRDITLTGNSNLKPDFTWIKNRDTTDQFVLTDIVRGVTKYWSTDGTDIEVTDVETLASFDTDGFSLGDDVQVNTDTEGYISWNWLAGGDAGASNTAGSINTTTTSVSTLYGFSTGTYTGTGAAATVGHGLGVIPRFIMLKKRDGATGGNPVYHYDLDDGAGTNFLDFAASDANAALTAAWNDTGPTTDVFSLGTNANWNGSGQLLVYYCWHDVEGYSKFGSYTGNGSADGPFVYLGFKPSFIICKSLGVENFRMPIQHSIDGYNDGTGRELFGDLPNASSTGNAFDVLSNGFKIRNTSGGYNTTSVKYIYMAWAKHPFGGIDVAPMTGF